MLDTTEPITRPAVTYAFISSTMEVEFYGELADKYEALFKRDSTDILNTEIAPSYSFLAQHGFSAVSNNFFQNIDIITL